jgi:hypothetical protein
LLLCSCFKTLPRKAAKNFFLLLKWNEGCIEGADDQSNSPAPQEIHKYISKRFQVIPSALFWPLKQEQHLARQHRMYQCKDKRSCTSQDTKQQCKVCQQKKKLNWHYIILTNAKVGVHTSISCSSC